MPTWLQTWTPPPCSCPQVCFQVWLASSLLADSLAVAAQALLARTLAARDSATGRLVARRTTQLVLGLGLALALGLAATSGAWPGLFTKDAAVLRTIGLLVPLLAATQPVNGLAFLLDGLLYGWAGGWAEHARAALGGLAGAGHGGGACGACLGNGWGHWRVCSPAAEPQPP